MSLFKKIFANSEEKEKASRIEWVSLTELGQLERLIKESNINPVVVFKHSTRCSISRMALRQFELDFDSKNEITPYFLDLIEYRAISNAISDRFGVTHQSPQIVLIKNEKAVFNASHESIDANILNSYK